MNPGSSQKACPKCQTTAPIDARFCSRCGHAYSTVFDTAPQQTQAFYAPQPSNAFQEANGKKIAAGVCGIVIGCLGIHKFILGYSTAGIIMLVGSVVTCGIAAPVFGIIGLVEGIMYLTKTDQQFYYEYMAARKEWF